jgi:nitronate monooxygenase
VEAPLHPNIKRALLDASERDTTLIFRSMNNTARVLRNAVSDEVVGLERRAGGCRFEDIVHLVNGERGRAALRSGDTQGGIITAGIVVGLIHDVPTCAELLERMVAEARTHLRRAQRFLDI